MASLDRRLNPLHAIKECSSCGNLHTKDCGCPKGSLEDKILVPIPDLSQRPSAPQEPFVFNQDPSQNVSQSPPNIDHHCCYKCGDLSDDIFCHRCTCESCRKGAHYGYNCPQKVPIISNLEPCHNQTIDELPQTLPSVHPSCYSGDENSFTYDSNLNFVNDSPNPTPQPPTYTCEFCRNDARYGHYCTPQVPIISNPEPCYNQNYDEFPQSLPSFQQQILCCENCGGLHVTFECQPMNQDFHDSGLDQFQPPQSLVIHQPPQKISMEALQSREDLMKSIENFLKKFNRISFRETSKVLMQAWDKFLEIKHAQSEEVQELLNKLVEDVQNINEELAEYTNTPSWNLPTSSYDNDDDEYSFATQEYLMTCSTTITPILLTEEPVDSLIMEDEHLDTILATESDEVIKSSVENLVPIPSESEGIPDSVCDVPLCNNPTLLKAFKEHSKIVINFNDDSTSSDDDSPYGEDIDYVYASPIDYELVSLEVVEIVIPEDGEIEDDILREKLSKINLLIAKIEALNTNPTRYPGSWRDQYRYLLTIKDGYPSVKKF
ncbi:hypothetical protein Tco_0553341 [Tanacetum coccineum]